MNNMEGTGKKIKIVMEGPHAFRVVGTVEEPPPLNVQQPSSSEYASGYPAGGKRKLELLNNREIFNDSNSAGGEDYDNDEDDDDYERADGDSGETGDEDDDDVNEEDDDKTSQSQPLKKGTKKVCVMWTNHEVSKMLNICHDKHVVQKMDGLLGQNLSRKQIFTSVAKVLEEANISKQEKTWSHCFDKFKKVRKMYRQCMRKNNKSGEGRHTCKFFDELNNLLHKRPTVMCEGWGFEAARHEDDGPSAPQLERGEENQSSTASSSSSTRKPPKYRGGAAKENSTTVLLREWMEIQQKEGEKEREWLQRREEMEDRRSERQFDAMQNMATTFASAIASGFERCANVMFGMQQQQQQNSFLQPETSFSQPQQNSFSTAVPSVSPCNFETPLTPKSSPTYIITSKSTSSRSTNSSVPSTPMTVRGGPQVINIPSSAVSSLSRSTNSSVPSTPVTVRGGPRVINIPSSAVSSLLYNRQTSPAPSEAHK